MRVHSACELARAAIGDGADSLDLTSLAKLGTGGMWPGNEHRDYRKLQEKLRGAQGLVPFFSLLKFSTGMADYL